MPRVKIDYVVSFSSEDAEHPASNLLAWEVSKKKWLCKKGETSCSVVLQLTKAVKISSVHIGGYHAALVEVLVGRSEKHSDQFQVLVPSCVFVSPRESRADAAVERVRSFSAEQLAADARDQAWDRLRLVCSQPYNKHARFGLSFVHVESADAAAAPPPPRPSLALATLSSDEDEFRPGELFARHVLANSQGAAPDTGAQIRHATSQALKNIPDPCTKLMKTAISKPKTESQQDSSSSEGGRVQRSRDALLYTRDEEQPHDKIDRVVKRHQDLRVHEEQTKSPHDKKHKHKQESAKVKGDVRAPKRKERSSPPPSDSPVARRHKGRGGDDTGAGRDRVERAPSEEAAEPHKILSDVVVVLSGYENPGRALVRNTALALGARVRRDWGPDCTHLICAFPNTPKLRRVRAACARGTPVARADWLLQCSARRRRLPWQWFATEDEYRLPEPEPHEAQPARGNTPTAKNDSLTDCDTDDEIEKVLQKQKTKNDGSTSREHNRSRHDADEDTDEETDQNPDRETTSSRGAGAESDGGSTDEAERAPAPPRLGGALPDYFAGHTFAVRARHPAAHLMERYVRAYGGLVLPLSQAADSAVQYVVCDDPGTPPSPRRGARPPRLAGALSRRRRAAAAGLTS